MKTKESGLFLTESQLQDRIDGKYPGPAWTVLNHLRDGTGFASAGQSADAVAFGTWPSRGFQIIGFECKSRRSDWLREIKNPAKAEAFASYCDQWFLVTGSDNVAKLEEIPKNWGWYVGTAKGLKLIKPAETLKPEPIDRVFLMSIARNIGRNFVPKATLEETARQRAETIAKSLRDDNKYDLQRANEQLKHMYDFERESGIDLKNGWSFNAADVGRVVKALLGNGLKYDLERLRSIMNKTGEVLKALEEIEIFKEKLKEPVS